MFKAFKISFKITRNIYREIGGVIHLEQKAETFSEGLKVECVSASKIIADDIFGGTI